MKWLFQIDSITLGPSLNTLVQNTLVMWLGQLNTWNNGAILEICAKWSIHTVKFLRINIFMWLMHMFFKRKWVLVEILNFLYSWLHSNMAKCSDFKRGAYHINLVSGPYLGPTQSEYTASLFHYERDRV